MGLGLAQVGFQLGEKEFQTANTILNTALDNGINFLDTAAMYLESESIVGNSVHGSIRRSVERPIGRLTQGG